MAVGDTKDDWMNDWRRRQEQQRQQSRDEFFKSGDRIPDLDLMPPCSICDGGLEYDDRFYCPECNVEWERNGTDGSRMEV